MSANNEVKIEKPIQSFQYRNIKKDFTTFLPHETVTSQCHLELDSDNKTKIVDDRNIDWVELQNKDVDSVGLANILDMARRGQVNLASFGFKDSEAIDTSVIDPMNPDALKDTLDTSQSEKKLKEIASQLGISVEILVDSFVNGTLGQMIKEKTQTQVKEETVDEK